MPIGLRLREILMTEMCFFELEASFVGKIKIPWGSNRET